MWVLKYWNNYMTFIAILVIALMVSEIRNVNLLKDKRKIKQEINKINKEINDLKANFPFISGINNERKK